MKLHTKNLKLNQLLLFVTANLLLVSCGTYQSVYNDDGIYSDNSNENKKIIVVNDDEYREYEDNYFTKELQRLNSLENNEIFTDVETYNSDDVYVDDDVIDETLNYNSSQPWGFEDNDVVVNVNLINDPYWYGYNNWGWGFNTWGFNNWNYWGDPFWGNRLWVNRFWGYNPYWHPYHNNLAWNGGFYNPYWRNNNYWNNNYYRNNSYGRRVTNNTYGRRSNNVNTRFSSTNRDNSNIRRSSDVIRRNTNGTRRSSTTRSSSSTIRRSSTTRGSSSNTRGSSSTRRSSSSRGNNGNYTPSRRSSSSSSSSSSRSSSSRSSSSRGSSSSSSSRRGGN